MKNQIWIVTLVLIAIVAGLGCSGGGISQGVTPDSLTKGQTSSAPKSGPVLWGWYDCYMLPGDNKIEVLPLRTPAFTANVNNLLEAKPGNMLIKDLDTTNYLTEGRIDCTVTLKHPLPGLNQYDGFDVWGVFMHNGSKSVGYDGLIYSDGSGSDEATMLNPDGYTRWYNYTEFSGTSIPILEFWSGKLADLKTPTATLNPYKIFADNLGVDDDYYTWINNPVNSADRDVYRAGVANSRRYQLKFPMVGGVPILHFQYAVIATWEPGDPTLTGNPATYEPGDFPSSANCEEAFFVHTTTIESDLWNDGTGAKGGTFKANIEVFDWQGGSVGKKGVPNEVNSFIINGDFLPGGTSMLDQSQLAGIATTGTENSSVFQVEIPNCTPVASGTASFWVVVEASGLNGSTYGQGFPTPYPSTARRAAFIPGTVFVDDQSPIIPPTVHYELDAGGLLFDAPGFDDISPALAWEVDDQLRCVWSSDGLASTPTSYPVGLRSDDGGLSWIDYQVYGGHGNAQLHDHMKIMPADNGNSFMLYPLCDKSVDNPYYEAGRSGDKSIDWNYANMFVQFYDCGEVFCASDGLIHVMGDDLYSSPGIYQEVGNQKWTWFYDWTGHPDPVPQNWWWYEVTPQLMCPSPARISNTRSIGDDSSGTVYMAYWGGPGNEFIKLAKSTDSSGALVWEQLNVFQQSGYTSVRDPGLDIDANDHLHVAFLRHNTATNKDEICYTRSTDGGHNWSTAKVVHSSTNVMTDTPIEAYTAFSTSIVDITFEDGDSIWFIYSFDGGDTWSDPTLVSEADPSVDRMPDMVVGTDNNLHFAWSHQGSSDWEIHFRNAVLVKD